MGNSAEENTFIKAYEDIEKSKTPIRGPEAFPLLEIVQGPKQGAWFTVAHQKEITLGRAATNSIILEDNSVSRSHSVLQATGEGFTVRDIGSRNGTFLNEKKIQGEVALSHLDAIKVGIYTLRYLTEPCEEPFEVKEEKTPTVDEVAEPAEPEGTPTEMGIPIEPESEAEIAPTVVESSPPEPVAEAAKAPPPAEKKPEENTINEDLKAIVAQDAAAKGASKSGARSFKSLGILLLILIFLGGGSYAAYHFGLLDKLKATKGKAGTGQIATGKTGKPKVLKPGKTKPVGQMLPIFLEVDATPIKGKVFYKGKELGQTPFKISVQVPPGTPQELSAEFYLDGLDEKITAKESFQVKQQDEVVKVQFKPKLGALKVKSLPKQGELYLEGKFEGEQGPSKSIQLQDVTFDVPIYLPHGKYIAEIRVPQLIEGSSAPVKQVKFRREFELGANQGEYELDAPEESLKSFPAKITTEPSGAELLIDGKKLGETPFEGALPMGRHKLIIKKEGFNDFEKEISIELNTPYVVNFNLETSPAGVFVNQGRKLLKKGKHNAAIEKLADALKRNPEPTELSQIHMLLGEAFLQSKTYDQALAYYQKAAEFPENANKAKLGSAEAHAGLGQKDQALIQIIDVFLNTKDPKLKSRTRTVYKRIAPMKSVLYVTSDPKGAQVTVNGNPIGQATPVILSDLMVGSYRIGISKPGFKNFESRVTVPMSAIKPVIVKLEVE